MKISSICLFGPFVALIVHCQIGRVAAQAVGPDGNRASFRPAGYRFKDILSGIEGQTKILQLVPNGEVVHEGQFVCKLDAAPLQNAVHNQKIAAAQTEANVGSAKLAREAAEIAVRENEAVVKLQVRQVIGEIKIAQSEFDYDKTLRARFGFESQQDIPSVRFADLTIEKARFTLEQAEGRKVILDQFTAPRREREVRVVLEKARADEDLCKTRASLERSKVEKLERQVPLCRIVAPVDGIVTYAARLNPIEEGATVRERELILRIAATAKPK